MAQKRPVLRWHGGKWRIAKWIISHFPPHRIYTEVFGGAASVLMQKDRCHGEVYNDLDGEVVNLFRVLRDPKDALQLQQALELTPFAREEFNLSYHSVQDPVERARRLVVTCFMGFGSNGHNTKWRTGFRSNSNRSHTTPAHDWANYPKQVAAMAERLLNVAIERRPAADILTRHDCVDALHYVDPPYVHSTRGGGHQRDYRFELDDEGHRALAKTLRELSGMVVLSGYPHPMYDEELYPDWHRVERVAFADGARKRVEVLWINPAAEHRMNVKILGDLM